ncbi:MAG: TetR/AcrR family transcriptional regulator [Caulobacterales bacterium]
MGHSQAHKSASREKILRAAAERLRQDGIEGLGVAELMKAVGLTHGGFYGHFANRDALVAEALALAQEHSRKRSARIAGDGEPSLEKLLESYLSPAHQGALARGCATAALAADAVRATPQTRAVFTEGLGRQLAAIETLLPADASPSRAAGVLAAMVGALILARASDDPELSQRFLDEARDLILDAVETAA